MININKRIKELENGLQDILASHNLETIKTIASDLMGEDPEDYLDELDLLDEDMQELDFDE